MSDVKKFFASFRQYPALGVALGVGVIALLYYVYKSNASTAPTAPTATTGPTTTTPQDLVYQFDITPPGPSTTTTSTPPTTTTPTPPIVGSCPSGYHFSPSQEQPIGILYQSGSYAVSGGMCIPDAPSPPIPTPPTPPTPPPPPPQPPIPTPPPTPNPTPGPQPQYVTVKRWPDALSTLSGIANYAGVSLPQVESLNPQYRSNYNLIYTGQQVRVR